MDISGIIVTGNRHLRRTCIQVFLSVGIEPVTADSIWETFDLLERKPVRMILVDLDCPWARCRVCPDRVGNRTAACCLEFLETAQQRHPEVDLVLLADLESGTRLASGLQRATPRLISKPLGPAELKLLLEGLPWKDELAFREKGLGELVGRSPKMQRVFELIRKLSRTRHPVLILGETGTGKELVARAIHALGPCKNEPFVTIDVAGIPATLIESELFGHVRGAFTGAVKDQPGLLAFAGRGTVFLDEIAEVAPELQAKFLRLLQDGEYRPVGGNVRKRLHAGIIAATNRDLEQAVRKGRFREDLYFRLNVVPIVLPPLRERTEDIPFLVRHFIALHGPVGKSGVFFTDEALGRLADYHWPGNVRELENAIKHALTLASRPSLGVADLPPHIGKSLKREAGLGIIPTIDELEREAIVRALRLAAGHRVLAAQLLGIGKTTIYRKLREYGLAGSPPSGR